MNQPSIFISYSHKDKVWKERLVTQLQVLALEGAFNVWEDRQIVTGEAWKPEIEKAINEATLAILLISADFLTSNFIRSEEVPPLLQRRSAEGVKIFPLILKPCAWQGVGWLAKIQVRPADGKSLASLRKYKADEILANTAVEIQALLLEVQAEAPLSAQAELNKTERNIAFSAIISPPTLDTPVATSAHAQSSPPPVTLDSVQRDLEGTPHPAPDLLTITTPIKLELVHVPAGEFLMGSNPSEDNNAKASEQPRHRVYVSTFYVGKYPITNEQYAAFVKATKRKAPGHWEKGKIPAGKEKHPVVGVSWRDAVAFCKWLTQETGRSFRLPTEAEWEKAARGTDGRLYPWGNQWDETKLNSVDGGLDETTPVGHYSPQGDSPYRAADIAGNVWEWCADWYNEKEYQRRANRPVKDPQGPKQGYYRVLRGCAFGDEAAWVRCAARDGADPNYGDYFYGLRVVASSL